MNISYVISLLAGVLVGLVVMPLVIWPGLLRVMEKYTDWVDRHLKG